jgi:hypothetical protein
MGLLGRLAGIVGLTYALTMVIGDAGNAAVVGPIGHGGSERMSLPGDALDGGLGGLLKVDRTADARP